jgi:hypothetical protein
MGRATLASVAIHVAAVLAIPALAWTASTAVPIETVSFAHVVRVEIVPPRASHPPPRAVAPRLDPHQHINLASHLRLIAALPHRHASPEPAIATNAPAAPAVASLQRAGTGTASGDAAPSTTPSPEVRAVASVGTHQSGGYLPFGAEQPDPVLDPGIRKQLAALGTHVTLTITVGEDGRTESIAFDPPVDAQLESRIRSLLADASWDPAVCGGGVACEARATIKL